MKKNVLFLFVQLMIISSAIAQEFKSEGVYEFENRGSGNIIEDEKMVGYYFFYKVDRTGEEDDAYKLTFKDENLATVKEIEIFKRKGEVLREVIYNGSNFACLFYNESTNILNIISYDKTGTKVGGYQIDPIHPYDLFKFKFSSPSLSLNYFKTIFPRGKDGFIAQVSNNDGYKGFLISGLDNKMNEVWRYSTPIDLKGLNYATVMDMNDKYVVLQTNHQGNLLSGKSEQGITVLDIKTGAKVAIFESEFLGKKTSVMDALIDPKTNEVVVVGDYLENAEKFGKNASDGIYFARYSVQGKEIKIVKVPYKGKIISSMDVAYQKMITDGSARILIRKTFSPEDGSVVVMGELIEKAKKNHNVWNANSRPMTKGKDDYLNSHQIVCFELGVKDDSVKIKTFEKAISSYSITELIKDKSLYICTFFELMNGAFDYLFNSYDRKHDVILTYFHDRGGLNLKGETSPPQFKIIKYEKGEFSTTNFEYKGDFDQTGILPAKYGFLTLLNYIRKERTVYWKLEKAIY